MPKLRSLGPLRAETFAALYRNGVRHQTIDLAYDRWEHGAAPPACKYQDARATVDCKCEGCLQRACMAMFEAVHSGNAAALVCSMRGHLYPTDLSALDQHCRRCGAMRP